MQVHKIIASGTTKHVASGGQVIDLIAKPGEHNVNLTILPGAVVELKETQELTDGDECTLNFSAQLGEGALLGYKLICTEGKKAKLSHNFSLARNSSVNFGAAFLANEGQKFELDTSVNHIGANSSSDLKVYGALLGQSSAASRGNIKIQKTGQGTKTFFASHALLLDKRAKAESVPALEIEANDVRAGHSSSTTKLSEEQVFYATSRGISEQEARKMIVMGFLSRAFSGENVNLEKIEQKWNK